MSEAQIESAAESNGEEPAHTQGQDRLAQAVASEKPPRLPFPVVGMGSSAGGLEAFIEFFDVMPPDAGMAFVLIQHLPPDRESMIADILSKHTRMPTRQVENEMPVEANNVYIIRPGHTLTIKEGKLHLGARLDAPGHNRPVDDFFRSLAEEQQERAIAIVMSGMGANGTQGSENIKAVVGHVIAQEPERAKDA
jgi:two-component system CheB/CheR fusion protein